MLWCCSAWASLAEALNLSALVDLLTAAKLMLMPILGLLTCVALVIFWYPLFKWLWDLEFTNVPPAVCAFLSEMAYQVSCIHLVGYHGSAWYVMVDIPKMHSIELNYPKFVASHAV